MLLLSSLFFLINLKIPLRYKHVRFRNQLELVEGIDKIAHRVDPKDFLAEILVKTIQDAVARVKRQSALCSH